MKLDALAGLAGGNLNRVQLKSSQKGQTLGRIHAMVSSSSIVFEELAECGAVVVPCRLIYKLMRARDQKCPVFSSSCTNRHESKRGIPDTFPHGARKINKMRRGREEGPKKGTDSQPQERRLTGQ